MITIYNKLVRDKIPQIIEADERKVHIRCLAEEEYLVELDRKLNEEIAEYQVSKELEEIADILEVLEAICKVRSYEMKEVLRVKREKSEARGKFDEKIYLESVESI